VAVRKGTNQVPDHPRRLRSCRVARPKEMLGKTPGAISADPPRLRKA